MIDECGLGVRLFYSILGLFFWNLLPILYGSAVSRWAERLRGIPLASKPRHHVTTTAFLVVPCQRGQPVDTPLQFVVCSGVLNLFSITCLQKIPPNQCVPYITIRYGKD